MSEPLTVQQAADELNYHTRHAYRLLESGRLEGQRLGKAWMIDHQKVELIEAFQGPGGRLPKPSNR